MSVAFCIPTEATGAVRSAPQGAHSHVEVIKLFSLIGIKKEHGINGSLCQAYTKSEILKDEAASENSLIFTNCQSGTPVRVQVTLLENCVAREEGGGILYREIRLEVSIITIITEQFNRM